MMKWDDKALKTEVREKARRKLIRAAETVRGETVRSFGSGSSGYKMRPKTKKKIEHWSSVPPAPPHVDTGRLRASITWAISEGQQQGNQARGAAHEGDQVDTPDREASHVIAIVGTNVEYARAHEFGFEPLGLRPRPFLRPALKRATAKIRYLFAHE